MTKVKPLRSRADTQAAPVKPIHRPKRSPSGSAIRPKPRNVPLLQQPARFTSNAMLTWAEEAKVDWHFIAPGSPQR